MIILNDCEPMSRFAGFHFGIRFCIAVNAVCRPRPKAEINDSSVSSVKHSVNEQRALCLNRNKTLRNYPVLSRLPLCSLSDYINKFNFLKGNLKDKTMFALRIPASSVAFILISLIYSFFSCYVCCEYGG